MSDTAAAPAAPQNGANGAQGHAAPVTPRPNAATATGPQTPSGTPARAPDGKFAPSKPGEPAKDAAPAPKPKVRIKDLELDEDAAFSEIQRGRQVSKSLTEAQKRLEKAEALEKAAAERKAKYREDPEAFFADLGIESAEERAKWASKYLYEKHIQPSQMTEEQRRMAEYEAKLAAYEAKEKEAATAKEQAEYEQISQAEEKKLRTQIGSMLKSGGMPARPLFVKRVAERIAAYEEKGIDVPVEDAARLVREETASDTADLLEKTPLDELVGLWGQDKFAGIVTRLISEGGPDGLLKAMGPKAFKAVANVFSTWAQKQISGRSQMTQQRPAPSPVAASKPEQWITPAELELRRRNGK